MESSITRNNAIEQISGSRLGGLRRIVLHGNPGTPEGRSKGGKTTIALFQRNPRLANKLGFIIRKKIKFPPKSVDLAELIGVVLGDGGLSGKYHLVISFNNKTDREYAKYLKSVLWKLFAVNCHIHCRKNNNGADIVVSSSNLVDFLLELGLKKGNKVKNQVDIPDWVYWNTEYQKACLRGLVDTDGGLYLHQYRSGIRVYKYIKLCFTNSSKPLLTSVFNILKRLKFRVYMKEPHVFIYAWSDVKRYFKEIGSHNPKHNNKFLDYFLN